MPRGGEAPSRTGRAQWRPAWVPAPTHATPYLLLLVIAGLGIANAFVRGVTLVGPLALPPLGDPEWRRPLTQWHGFAANVPMDVAAFHATATLVHHYLWHDAVLHRILPGRALSAPYERP